MFGIFKSSTPETILADDLKKTLEQEIKIVLKEIGNNEFLAGFAIEAGISNVYKAYKDNVHLLAAGHKLTPDNALAIIKKTTNDVRKKYLINPTLIE